MNCKFKSDFYRMTGEEKASFLRRAFLLIFSPHIRYVKLHRKYEKRKSIFTRARLYRLSKRYGLEIATSASIGEGLYLGHPYNITVAGGVKMGKKAKQKFDEMNPNYCEETDIIELDEIYTFIKNELKQ